jgi:hypothetical protein
MADQSLVQRQQVIARGEHHIAGPFTLRDGPVVTHGTGAAVRQVEVEFTGYRMDSAHEVAQQGLPGRAQLLVHQSLSSRQVVDAGEAVALPHIADSGAVELAGQPLSSIEADL